jgi:hypothetical protein
LNWRQAPLSISAARCAGKSGASTTHPYRFLEHDIEKACLRDYSGWTQALGEVMRQKAQNEAPFRAGL